MRHNFYGYLLVMAAVTAAVRILPLTLIRSQIRNRFLRSFLYYVPYVTLSVMTFPAIMDATQSPYAGLAALAVGLNRLELIIRQMQSAEGVTEDMKRTDQMLWVRSMNSIRNRAEEIVKHELIYCSYAEGGE